MNEDVVNKPKHYISETGLETIDVITAFTKGLDGAEAFCAGNALKYLCRWNHKNGTEDLRKAIWYINRLISIREKKDNGNAGNVNMFDGEIKHNACPKDVYKY